MSFIHECNTNNRHDTTPTTELQKAAHARSNECLHHATKNVTNNASFAFREIVAMSVSG